MAIAILKIETLPLTSDTDIVAVRRQARQLAMEARFSLVDQTKLVTAASELARNALEHGGGGEARMEMLSKDAHLGVRLTFTDGGPGIADVEQALRDGYTTGSGMGLGLGGSRRLSNEFAIESKPGAGTRVTIIRWK